MVPAFTKKPVAVSVPPVKQAAIEREAGDTLRRRAQREFAAAQQERTGKRQCLVDPQHQRALLQGGAAGVGIAVVQFDQPGAALGQGPGASEHGVHHSRLHRVGGTGERAVRDAAATQGDELNRFVRSRPGQTIRRSPRGCRRPATFRKRPAPAFPAATRRPARVGRSHVERHTARAALEQGSGSAQLRVDHTRLHVEGGGVQGAREDAAAGERQRARGLGEAAEIELAAVDASGSPNWRGARPPPRGGSRR
jgi:hypothetical protein